MLQFPNADVNAIDKLHNVRYHPLHGSEIDSPLSGGVFTGRLRA